MKDTVRLYVQLRLNKGERYKHCWKRFGLIGPRVRGIYECIKLVKGTCIDQNVDGTTTGEIGVSESKRRDVTGIGTTMGGVGRHGGCGTVRRGVVREIEDRDPTTGVEVGHPCW